MKVPVVIDNGSGMCKVGFGGNDAPKSSFQSIIGRQKYPNSMNIMRVYAGEEAMTKKGSLNLSYPIERGTVSNWDDMTTIWKHCYNELGVDSSEHPCLLTETPLNSRANREKIIETMFETFEVPSCYLTLSAVLSLHACGKTTGLVLESGRGVTSTVPIYEGSPQVFAIENQNFAGQDVTEYLRYLLRDIGLNFYNSAHLQTVRDIKEKHCYVALDYKKETTAYQNTSKNNKEYVLPDGKTITLGRQRQCCPQILFNPNLIGKQMLGFHKMCFMSILRCDKNIHNNLYSNIVMSGGTVMHPGIFERFEKQITDLSPSTVKVVAPVESNLLAWRGGSILSSLSTFQRKSITKQDYYETGKTIVHKKCSNNQL